MIDYEFAVGNWQPQWQDGLMYKYVVGKNGIFVQAERPGLQTMIWIAATLLPVRGLMKLAPFVWIRRVPKEIVMAMLHASYVVRPNEILFYLLPNPWRVMSPDQIATSSSVKPSDPFDPAARRALIEVHSHHTMAPFFSHTDDRDETGFKIYAVIGHIDRKRAAIRTRVGIYGHFQEIPSSWVFEIPAGLDDALSSEEEI